MYTPGLWLHEWRPIQFSLVVDDFGVKYVGEENEKLERFEYMRIKMEDIP